MRYMPYNYQLYARILRLMTSHEDHCRAQAENGIDYHRYLYGVVRDVIATDRTLVWC